jgi:hypothetical protein
MTQALCEARRNRRSQSGPLSERLPIVYFGLDFDFETEQLGLWVCRNASLR